MQRERCSSKIRMMRSKAPSSRHVDMGCPARGDSTREQREWTSWLSHFLGEQVRSASPDPVPDQHFRPRNEHHGSQECSNLHRRCRHRRHRHGLLLQVEAGCSHTRPPGGSWTSNDARANCGANTSACKNGTRPCRTPSCCGTTTSDACQQSTVDHASRIPRCEYLHCLVFDVTIYYDFAGFNFVDRLIRSCQRRLLQRRICCLIQRKSFIYPSLRICHRALCMSLTLTMFNV